MNKLESKFGIGKIVIIESIPENEPQTGTKLYNELMIFEKIHQTGISIEYKKIDTAKEFFDYLNELNDNVKSDRKMPLLHIEAHGNQDVLELSSCEKIYWTELLEPFTKINIATRNNLSVVIAACFGAHLRKIIKMGNLGRSPIFAAIGPLEEANPREIELGYQAFYREIFETNDINKAMDMLNQRRLDKTKEFTITTAQYIFYKACTRSINERNSEQRKKDIGNLIKSHPIAKNLPKKLRRLILKNAFEQDQIPIIEKLYNQFMMVDLFPENSLRFQFDITKIKS